MLRKTFAVYLSRGFEIVRKNYCEKRRLRKNILTKNKKASIQLFLIEREEEQASPTHLSKPCTIRKHQYFPQCEEKLEVSSSLEPYIS